MSRRGRGGNPISLFSFQDIITSVTGIMILVTLFLGLEVVRRRQGSPDHMEEELIVEISEASAQTTQVSAALVATRQEIERLRLALQSSDDALLKDVQYDPQMLERQLRDLDSLNRLIAQELDKSSQRRQSAAESLAELQKQDSERSADRKTLEELRTQTVEKLEELRRLKTANRVLFSAAQRSSKTPWLVELSQKGIFAAEVGKRGPAQSFADLPALLAWTKGRSPSTEYFVLLIKPATIEQFYSAEANLERQGFEIGFDLLKDDQTAIDPQTGAAP
jgi:hypothetical protein